MSKHLKDIFVVSSLTLVSRVLGLFRDVLSFAFLGLSSVNSAFIYAFTIPNLFRRLLGEGALTSALVPVFSDVLDKEGKASAFGFLNRVLSWLLLVLLFIMALCGLAYYQTLDVTGLQERWYLGAVLGMILIPYVVLVCIAAIMGAALNVLGLFAIHALTSVWLNIAMIFSLVVGGYFYLHNEVAIAYYLCAGVLLGGFLQVLIPAVRLITLGWRPWLEFTIDNRIKLLYYLFLPGLFGAAIFQINIVVTRFLAFYLNQSAVSVLYLTNRLVELPIGMFTIAVTTVLFPKLALHFSKKDEPGMRRAYRQGMLVILAITIPAALGMAVLRVPILELLFLWGRFSYSDLILTAPVLLVYSLGIPIYSMATFSTRGFHAIQDTKTPVLVGIVGLLLNVLFTVAFMFVWGTVGMALANILSAAIQAWLLQRLLGAKTEVLSIRGIGRSVQKLFWAGIIMAVSAYMFWALLDFVFPKGKVSSLIAVLLVIPASVFLYLKTLQWVRFGEVNAVSGLFRRFIGRK